MKIVFIAHGWFFNELYYPLAKECEKRNINAEFLTNSYTFEKFMKKKDKKVINIRNLAKKYVKEYSEEKLLEYLNRYGISNFDAFCFDEIQRYGMDKENLKVEVYSHLAALEDYFKNNKPDCICNVSEQLLSKTCEKVANKNGIIFLHPAGSVFPNTFYWDTSLMIHTWVKKDYLNKNLTPDAEKRVSEYIEKTKRGKPVIGGISKGISLPEIARKFIMNYIYNYFFIERCKNYDYTPLRLIKTYVLSSVRQKLAKKYYTMPNFEEKYIFFPLHVPDDAQITFRAVPFYRQDLVVELCSKAIPDGYALYVKEHPHGKGRIPLSWLKKIVSLSNVKLVPPDINAHDLIEHSNAIITINSDVGWEALLHYKPVVVLAKPFYSSLGVTFDLNFQNSRLGILEDDRYLNELSRKIQAALAQGKIDDDKIYMLVNTVMNSLYYGSSFYEERYDTTGNIKRIADTILDKYSQIRAEYEKPF